MDKLKFYNDMKEKLSQININNSDEIIDKFYKYTKLLLEWNKKINLTSITEQDEIILKHFIDSLMIESYIKDNSKIVDIGTGAGFPGIPLRLVNDTYDITLVDSLNKRINFLNAIIDNIGLKNIKTIHARAEEFAHDNIIREQYDVAVSRAVAQLNVLLEYLLPLVKVGGYCICMKGKNIESELKDSEKALKILGGKIEKNIQFKLLNTDIDRSIIIIKKVKKTPNKFPRKAGMPSKNPII